jgi:hypothetical protein
MFVDNNKFDSFSNVNNFSDYDLDYLRMQIKKNAESLERSIAKLRTLSTKSETEETMEDSATS